MAATTSAIKFLIRGEDKSKAAFRTVNRRIGKLSKKLFSLKTAMIGALGITGAGALAGNILKTGDKMHKLSMRLGVSTEALSQLQHAANMSGVAFDTLAMGMQRMTRRVAEAAQGTGEARGALEGLGIDAQGLAQLAPEDQFMEIAAAMQAVENQSDKVRLAMKLFDSEGVALIQLMDQGAEGLNKMMQEADALGSTLAGKDAVAIATFNDSLSKVKTILVNVSRDIMLHFMPAITDLLLRFSDWWKINKDIVAMRIGDYWELVKEKIKALWPYVEKVAKWFFKVGEAIVDVINKVVEFSQKFKGAFSSFGMLKSIAGWFSGGGGEEEQTSEAAVVAASGGGDTTLSDDEQWAEDAMSRGSTVVINQQLSRSDVTAIINESSRQQGRI